MRAAYPTSMATRAHILIKIWPMEENHTAPFSHVALINYKTWKCQPTPRICSTKAIRTIKVIWAIAAILYISCKERKSRIPSMRKEVDLVHIYIKESRARALSEDHIAHLRDGKHQIRDRTKGRRRSISRENKSKHNNYTYSFSLELSAQSLATQPRDKSVRNL